MLLYLVAQLCLVLLYLVAQLSLVLLYLVAQLCLVLFGELALSEPVNSPLLPRLKLLPSKISKF